jgi:hypothetical protein
LAGLLARRSASGGEGGVDGIMTIVASLVAAEDGRCVSVRDSTGVARLGMGHWPFNAAADRPAEVLTAGRVRRATSGCNRVRAF